MERIIMLFLFCLGFCYSIAQPTFNKVYGASTGTANDAATVIAVQNGYFLVGSGFSDQYNGALAIKLLRVDNNGIVLWEKDYGDTTQYYEEAATGGSAKETSDSGYIIPGVFRNSLGIIGAVIIRMNSQGDTLWTHTFSYGKFTQLNDLVITPDKGFAAAGETTGLGDTTGNVYLVKVDSNGKFLWQKTYGGNQEDGADMIGLTPDGGFILSGITFSFGPGTSSNYLIRTDSIGDTLWTRTYGTNDGQNGQCQAQPDMDGGFLMFGTWDTVNAENNGPNYVAKLDSEGNIEWFHLFNDSIALGQARELTNGDILVAGSISTPIDSYDVGYLAKLNSNGNELWDKTIVYDGPLISSTYAAYDFGEFYDFQSTTDGGLVLTGTNQFVDTASNNIQYIWLVKIDSVTTGIEEIATQNDSLKIYPNPAYSSVTIEWQANGANEATVEIYDMLGREVSSQQISSGKAEVNVSGLQDGLYVVRVLGNDGEVLGNSKLAVVRGR